jgi:hypothetical protein
MASNLRLGNKEQKEKKEEAASAANDRKVSKLHSSQKNVPPWQPRAFHLPLIKMSCRFSVKL